MLCNSLGPRHCQNNWPFGLRPQGPVILGMAQPSSITPQHFLYDVRENFLNVNIHQLQSHQSTYEFDRNAKLVY